MPSSFGIVDLFAGPGGLGEGFASLEVAGHSPFRIGISVEKEASAHRTLTLRAFLREYQARHGKLPPEFINFHAGLEKEPDWSTIDAVAWQAARTEACALELGTDSAFSVIDSAIAGLKEQYDDTILIGGPPCQAYSLVGRARSRGKVGYVPEEDERHFLFREYIRVLEKLRPAAFIMENVKGMLSSTIESRLVFEMLMEDLSSLGTGKGHQYELRAIRIEDGKASFQEAGTPSDFIVRAEDFGVPQRRHRVIIVGIRTDLAGRIANAVVVVPKTVRTVNVTIGKMPALRSGISRGRDDASLWRKEVMNAARLLAGTCEGLDDNRFGEMFSSIAATMETKAPTDRSESTLPEGYGESNDDLMRWLERPQLTALAQHETRGHMASDLGRYPYERNQGQRNGCKCRSAIASSEMKPGSWLALVQHELSMAA